MNSLKYFTIEEMQDEIKRRLHSKPEVLSNIDWQPVIDFVNKEIINETIKNYEFILFEKVMESMFGENIWDWWNNKKNEAPQSDQ